MNFSETQIRVRYGETDQMGIVYHANYAQYFEIGRTEWLRQLDITYSSMEKNGIMLPVVSLEINYRNSARYDDLLKVKTMLKRRPTSSIKFDYELYNEANILLTTGSTVLAFIDTKNNKPTRCPEYLLNKLQNYSL